MSITNERQNEVERTTTKNKERTDLTIWNCPNWSQYRAMLFDVFDLNVKKRFDFKCLEVENVSKCLKWCFVYFFVRNLLSFWFSRISLSLYFAPFERKMFVDCLKSYQFNEFIASVIYCLSIQIRTHKNSIPMTKIGTQINREKKK